MSRSIPGSLVSRVLRAVDRVSAPAVAEAHCDIPCGIYDPHLMQIAALTVVRMNQLIDGLELPAEGKNKAEQAKTDELVNELIEDRLKRPDCENGCILDGYPRSLVQAKALDAYLLKARTPLDSVLYFTQIGHNSNS